MRPKYLIAVTMVALAAAPLQAQSVRAGIDEWQRGNYANAVAIWRPLAEGGDPDAEFNLGQAYRLGRGLQANATESQKWFERAAAQGHVDAETTLGLLLFQTGDQAGGLKWLKLAADQDEPRAMLVYGTALYNGDGVTQDPVLGYAYVRRAAAQGLAPAKDTLAQLDSLMSAQDRRQGAVTAEKMSKAAGSAAFGSSNEPKAAKPTKMAQRSPAKPPKPVKTAIEPVRGTVTAATEPQAAKPVEVGKPPKPVESASPRPPKKPTAKPASTSRTAAAVTGGWRIQVGAFSQKGNAEALYKKLGGNGALAGRKPFYVVAGPVIRLQVGPFESKAAAVAACNAVASACFPVPAK
jgi:cell division septation protein DedD